MDDSNDSVWANVETVNSVLSGFMVNSVAVLADVVGDNISNVEPDVLVMGLYTVLNVVARVSVFLFSVDIVVCDAVVEVGLIIEAETTCIGSVELGMCVSIDEISAVVGLVADCKDLLTGLVFWDSVVMPLYEIVDDSLFALVMIAERLTRDDTAADMAELAD